MVCRVQDGDQVAFFEERILDADVLSYRQANLTWEAISNRVAEAKKAKYQGLAEKLRASFTLLIASTEGVLHVEYAAYFKRLASKLTTNWQYSYCGDELGSSKNSVCHHQGRGPPTPSDEGKVHQFPPPGWFRPWGSLVLI